MARKYIVMGICGTYTLKSANGRMLEIVGKKLESHGIDWVVWNNEDSPLPFVGEDGCWDHPNVKKYKDIADSVDAFVLSSPEYHGTMSGVMKNTLDWLYKDHVGGKVFGLMSTLGGIANSNTLNHLRICIRWLHGWVVPEQLAIGNVKEAFTEDGDLTDESNTERLEKLVASVVKHASLLRDGE